MHFLQPHWLHLLWIAVIPIALYLFRRKAKRVPVSTLLFFRSLAREHQESAWLRRLKRWLSLLLTLLILMLTVLALSRPFREGGGDAPRSLVVLLDRSASMAATDAEGKSRMDQAKEQLKDRLRALPDNVITSLVVYDGKVDIVQSRSMNRRETIRLIESVQAVPVEDDAQQGIAAAKRLAELESPSEIWHVSDHPLAESKADTDVHYRFMNVALQKSVNVGITAFQIRPAPLSRNRYEAFIEVTAADANPAAVEVTLETRLDGRPVQLRQMELNPGASNRLILPLEGGKGQILEMEIKSNDDALAWDNLIMAPLPETRPLVVAWFSESPDPFTELALSSMLAEDRIQVLKGGAKDWPIKDKPDVYVFENWLPETWPTDRPVLVLNPPGNSGPVKARKLDTPVPYESVRAVRPDHPLLFRVVNSRVAITQTAVLNVGDTMETLWMAGNEPVLVAGEANGQRVVVTAFQPSRSEQLALLPAFPLLIGNAIYWCVEHASGSSTYAAHHTGDVVPVKAGLVKWRFWDGRKVVDSSIETTSNWLELDRIGMFQGANGKDVSSLLLSTTESNVPIMISAVENDTATEREERWAVGGSWWAVLLWTVLGLLLVESWLFHREAVY